MPTAFSRQLKSICLAGAALAALTTLSGFASTANAQMIFLAPNTSANDEAGTSGAAPQASAEAPVAVRPAGSMVLGDAAPAPMGFLRFCARRPDQCGVVADPTPGPNRASAEERAQQLMAKYYWQVAFASGTPGNLRLMPTSGDGASAAAPQATSAGRYNWSAIFGPVAASAPMPVQSAPAAIIAETPAQGEVALTASPEAAPRAPGVASAHQEALVIDAAVHPAVAPALVGIDLDQLFLAPSSSSATPVEISWSDQSTASPPLAADWNAAPASPVAAPSVEAKPALQLLTWASRPVTPILSDAVLRSEPSPTVAVAPPAAPSNDASQAPATAAPLAADHALMSLLDRVNLSVNGAIRYVSDERQYGVDDYWTLPLEAGGSAAGDCKDYVLEKRRALIDAGVSAADLSIAIVKTTWGETHAVLLVSTDRGELVLDSLSSWIRPWRQTPYRWVERQAPGEQLVWVKIVAGRTV